MSDMVERVKAAISSRLERYDMDETIIELVARAAIEAMREPTEEMTVRHWTTLEYSGDVRERCHAVWRDMIDVALKE